MAKTISWIQHTKKNRSRKKWEDGKASYELMNNAVYGETMENLKNKIDVKLVSNKKSFKISIYNGQPNQSICHTKYLTAI